MGKQWVRAQIKHNELQDILEAGLAWVSRNRKTAGIAAGSALAAVLLVSGILYQRKSLRSEAWNKLWMVQAYAYSNRLPDALEQMKGLAADYPNTPATAFGWLFAGDMLFPQGKFQEAVEHYTRLIEMGTEGLQPYALNGLAISFEAAGQPQKAAEAAQRFLDLYPDHFLAPQVHGCLARSLKTLGQLEQAKGALQRITIQYQDTSWAKWAQDQLQSK
ncbi:MAG: tetratricopeptide repeat protein [Elusimicrobia bacterium]|nr:tetratricopeptide repeat protein [Elusimicrobiota bacterium]